MTVWSPDDARLCDFRSDEPVMAGLIRELGQVVGTDCSLLLLGETGVGKDRLAQAIHRGSSRATGPFVRVNCGALPDHLVENELFGHRKGAFTGAEQDRRGFFQKADRGTLLLDEIGEMSLSAQVKLLGVLDDQKIHRLGDVHTQRVDVRILAATNQNLAAAIAEGRFREDLYYRLAAVALEIPPLRERKGDLLRLIDGMLTYLARKHVSTVSGVSPKALDALLAHEWRGNVRELVHVMERAVLVAECNLVEWSDLTLTEGGVEMNGSTMGGNGAFAAPKGVGPALQEQALTVPFPVDAPPNLQQAKDVFFHKLFSGYLRAAQGCVHEAAELAGISPQAFRKRMSALGLKKDAYL